MFLVTPYLCYKKFEIFGVNDSFQDRAIDGPISVKQAPLVGLSEKLTEIRVKRA